MSDNEILCKFPELPSYPNVDPFNYEAMKKMLVDKLDSFSSAPFTIQRISELLSEPRKQYSRVDKFMRAVEKTILVVSTTPPGRTRTESSDSLDSGMNGDFSDVNVDIDMDGQETNTNNSNHKDNNHDIGHENDKVKDDKEEQKDDAVKGTITKVTVDSVSITVIESERTKNNNETVKDSTEVKAEENLLNEPIRSAENEILVETAELISETPPLAALENIVATTDPSLSNENISQIVVPLIETKVVESVVEKDSQDESTEIESKRIKLSEEVLSSAKVEEKEIETVSEPIDKVEEKPIESPKEVEKEVNPSTSTEEQNETESVPLVETENEVPKPQDESPPAEVDEKVVEPVVEIPIEDQEPPPVVETPSEMEAAPIQAIVENKMDEEEPAATTIEQEMTPIANKMDTDDATVEAAPMEFEEDGEPMDQ
jgi:serine/threonine-protein phosphatase 4 regulatory subunit 2